MEKTKEDNQTRLATETAPAAVSNPDAHLSQIVEESSIEGLNGGVILFLRKRNLGSIGDEKSQKFAALITAEFANDEAERKLYPLKKSIAKHVRYALQESAQTFKALYDAGENENLRKVVRLIVAGEMMNIMQEELEQVMACYNA